MRLNADDLSQYTEADFTVLEQVVGKERKRRNKLERSKAKMVQLADTLGYTLAKSDGKETLTPSTLTPVETTTFDGKLDTSTG